MRTRQSENGNSNPLSPASIVQTACIQPKLEIGAVNDPLEQEADSMADKVMGMQSLPSINTGSHDSIRRKSLTSFIQRKESAACGVASDALSNQIRSASGSGKNMDAGTRSFMENGFGTDFTGVKIHTDEESIQMNRELNAKAFATGKDIYFNEGQYQPSSSEGRHLLAHELTHVIQQNAVADFNGISRNSREQISRNPDKPCKEDEDLPQLPPIPTQYKVARHPVSGRVFVGLGIGKMIDAYEGADPSVITATAGYQLPSNNFNPIRWRMQARTYRAFDGSGEGVAIEGGLRVFPHKAAPLWTLRFSGYEPEVDDHAFFFEARTGVLYNLNVVDLNTIPRVESSMHPLLGMQLGKGWELGSVELNAGLDAELYLAWKKDNLTAVVFSGVIGGSF